LTIRSRSVAEAGYGLSSAASAAWSAAATLVFEDVEIVVDADPRQLDQLVTEMYWLGGGAPRGEQPDDFRHVALIGGRVSSHQQSDPHSISSPRSTASGGQLTAAPGRYNLVSDGQVPYQQ